MLGANLGAVYHSGLLEYRQDLPAGAVRGLYPAFWIFYEHECTAAVFLLLWR